MFTHFAEMHEKITCAQAALTVATACSEIDRVLSAVRSLRLPGYILIPADVAAASAAPPAAPLPDPALDADPVAVAGFTAAARRLLATAPDVTGISVLSGLLTHRFGAAADLAALLAAGPLTHATTVWGKSLVDETDPGFAGTYAGAASADAARRTVEDASVLILAGVQFTDLNSGFFTQQIVRERTIEIGASAVSVGAALYLRVPLQTAIQVLKSLVAELASGRGVMAGRRDPAATLVRDSQSAVPAALTAPLSQQALWDRVARFLRPGDIVLADLGTSFFGAATHRLPRDVTFIGQPLWAAIGYTLPALLGACLACPGRRGILLIGDGAAQMTAQELSTIARARPLRWSWWSTMTATRSSGRFTAQRRPTTTSPTGTGRPRRRCSARARWAWPALS